MSPHRVILHGLRVGVSVCFDAPDPVRPVFTGKALQYVERSLIQWLSRNGALPVVVPAVPDVEAAAAYARWLDGLVLHGGADVSPQSYGATALRPEWQGDRARDEYEVALAGAFLAAGKPILGVCRGMQLLNVMFGGTLCQDIATQLRTPVLHRDRATYDANFHEIQIAHGSWMRAGQQQRAGSRVNSIHHPGGRPACR